MVINETGTDFGRTSLTFQLLRDEVRAAAPEGLAKASPLRNAERAALPVLLIHGAQDTVVGPLHSQQMNEALKKAGKPVEYVEIAGENHYFNKTQSRVIVLEKLEAFLGKHLGVPGGQPATPADR
jgi:dipeptidyl aminopeptidase/acylaminoacyl peptidase